MIKLLTYSIALFLLVIAGSIGYYFVLYLPQQEQAKQQAQQEQQAQVEANKRNQVYLQATCLDGAEKSYQDTWADDCKTYAQTLTNGYQNCLNTGPYLTDTQSFCRSIWNTPDPSAKCSLPASMAESLNNSLQQEKDNCFKEYPL